MIFKLVRNDPKYIQGSTLGYDWIEVLAFIPMSVERNPESKTKEIHNWAICRTENGLTRIGEDDLFFAIEENVEYVEAREPS
jgi:hypothetical protein